MAYKIDIKLTKDDDLPWWWTDEGIEKYGSVRFELGQGYIKSALKSIGLADNYIDTYLADLWKSATNKRELHIIIETATKQLANKFMLNMYGISRPQEERDAAQRPMEYINYQEEVSITEI